jgi:hypothetical protein
MGLMVGGHICRQHKNMLADSATYTRSLLVIHVILLLIIKNTICNPWSQYDLVAVIASSVNVIHCWCHLCICRRCSEQRGRCREGVGA